MISANDFNDQVELFFGDASDALARVYVRLRGADTSGLSLGGVLTGPQCHYAQTLPARFDFVDRGRGPSLLAEAIVPEPCFWTPEMPHHYQASIELREGDRPIAQCQRLLGIRTLGAAGRNLIYDGKRWVVRGVGLKALIEAEIEQLHSADTAGLVPAPSDALCRYASRVGAMLMAELDEPRVDEIRRLARWPAVAIVTLPADEPLDLDGLAHNLLLAARFGARKSLKVPPWAQLAMVDVNGQTGLAEQLSQLELPVIARGCPRQAGGTILERRLECDGLQRDLAGRTEFVGRDFAGYIV